MSNSKIEPMSLQEADRERKRHEFFSKAAFLSWSVNWVVPLVALLVIYIFLV